MPNGFAAGARGWLRGAVLLTVLLAAACSRPYATPVIERTANLAADAPLPGLRGLVDDAGTTVLWTHGMCDTDRDWAEGRFALIAEGLGVPAPPPDDDGHRLARAGSYEADPPGAGGALERWRGTLAVDGRPLTIDFLIWSPLTDPFKDRLDFDAAVDRDGVPDAAFPYRRASLNDDLKYTLINRCLTDAVVYLGPNGAPMRATMRAALCDALVGGAAAPDGPCRTPPSAETALTETALAETALARQRILLVAESLGSKILFDALRDLLGLGDPSPPVPSAAPDARTDAAAFAALLAANLTHVYLLSNQIPLLDGATTPGPRSAAIDGPPPATAGSIGAVLQRLRAVRDRPPPRNTPLRDIPRRDGAAPAAGATGGRPTIVSFTDPNDLLSYRLTADTLGLEAEPLFNVVVSNTPTVLGLLQRPDTAHLGYRDNPAVIRLMAEGTGATAPGP